MTSTILIPTDFSIESTQVLKEYLQNMNEYDSVKIILAAGYYKDENLRDLLFFSKTNVIKKLESHRFREALAIIDNKFKQQISSMQVELYSGWNNAAFKNFLEGLAVDQIIYAKDLQLNHQDKKWFSLVPLIQKVKYKQQEVAISQDEWNYSEVALAPLFNSK